MNWMELVLGIIGTGGFAYFVYEFYTMKVRKRDLEASLSSKYAEEWQKLYNEMKDYTDKKIRKLVEKIARMERRDEFRSLAIEQYRHCQYLPKGGECPVIKMAENVKTSVSVAAINNDIDLLEDKDEQQTN